MQLKQAANGQFVGLGIIFCLSTFLLVGRVVNISMIATIYRTVIVPVLGLK